MKGIGRRLGEARLDWRELLFGEATPMRVYITTRSDPVKDGHHSCIRFGLVSPKDSNRQRRSYGLINVTGFWRQPLTRRASSPPLEVRAKPAHLLPVRPLL